MTVSKCLSCNNSSFEVVVKNDIKDSKFKLLFVQCSKCGGVVGVMDYLNIGAINEDIKRKINDIEERLNQIDRRLQ